MSVSRTALELPRKNPTLIGSTTILDAPEHIEEEQKYRRAAGYDSLATR